LTNLKKFLELREHIQSYTCTKFKQYDEKSTTNETSTTDLIAEDSTTDENSTTDSEKFSKNVYKRI